MNDMRAQSAPLAAWTGLVAPERTPVRRPGSIRRTTTMQISWPDGLAQPVRLQGRGRDIFTAHNHVAPETLATDIVGARMEMAGTLISLDSSPGRPELQPLIGDHTIKGYRRRLSDLSAHRIGGERPLDTMLDDIAACSLICRWALTLWPDSPYYEAHPPPGRREAMEGICIGHAPNPTGMEIVPGRAEPGAVGSVQRTDDPTGWHDLLPVPHMNMHRVRRIDLWREDGQILVDAMFQDSASTPEGGRRAIHDYAVQATIDPERRIVTALQAQPRILPYPECPAAIGNLGKLSGTPLDMLRTRVLTELSGVAGCTHLNDAIRALAAIPWLLAQLDARDAS